MTRHKAFQFMKNYSFVLLLWNKRSTNRIDLFVILTNPILDRVEPVKFESETGSNMIPRARVSPDDPWASVTHSILWSWRIHTDDVFVSHGELFLLFFYMASDGRLWPTDTLCVSHVSAVSSHTKLNSRPWTIFSSSSSKHLVFLNTKADSE